MMDTTVELEGVNGDVVHLTGPRAGEEGMYLGPDIEGILDPPVEVFWDDQMDTPGEVYAGHRYKSREVTLVVHVLDDDGVNNWWQTRDTRYRKLWSLSRDAKLRFTTEHGRRTLYVRPVAQHKIDTKTDPRGRSINTVTTSLKAGDPFWHGEDHVQYWKPGAGDSTHNFVVDNPSDQIAWLTWVVPEKSRITLPDYDFREDPVSKRNVRLPPLESGETSVLRVNPRYKQLVADNGAPVLNRMDGKRLVNWLPEWLPPHEITVSIEGAQSDSEVQLRIPRKYTTPWGMF